MKEISDKYSILDYRFQWLKYKILKFFGENDEKIFNRMLQRHEGKIGSELKTFFESNALNTESVNRLTLFFYKTQYEKTHYKWVYLLQEVTRTQFGSQSRKLNTPPSPTTKSQSRGSAKGLKTVRDDATEGETFEKQESDKSAKKELGKRPESPATVIEMRPPYETQPVFEKVKILLQKKKILKQLHCHVGPLTSDHIGNQNVFFVWVCRKNIAGIPFFDTFREAVAEIPKYVLVGSIESNDLVRCYKKQLKILMEYTEVALKEPYINFPKTTEKVDKLYRNFYPTKEVTLSNQDDIMKAEDCLRKKQCILRFLKTVHGASECSVLDTTNRKKNIKKLTLKNLLQEVHEDPEVSKLVQEIRRMLLIFGVENFGEECVQFNTPIKNRIKKELTALVESLKWSLKLTRSDITIKVPNWPEMKGNKENLRSLSQNGEFVKKLEKRIEIWEKYIMTLLQKCRSRKIRGTGPLSEYIYWFRRENELGPFVMHCFGKKINRMLWLLKIVNSQHFRLFIEKRQALKNYYEISRDNSDYINVCMKYILDMYRAKSVREIASLIPFFWLQLRYLWQLSGYWSVKSNLLGFIERVQYLIVNKCKKALDIKHFFTIPKDVSKQLALDVEYISDTWKNAFINVKSDIEKRHWEVRWELPFHRMFTLTDYIKKLSRDFYYLADSLLWYLEIFNKDFANVVREENIIETFSKRIEDFSVPFRTADFNIYDPDNDVHWNSLVEWFSREMSVVEKESLLIINQSFKNLKSSVRTLNLLLKWKRRIKNNKVYSLLMTKFECINLQTVKECRLTNSFIMEELIISSGAINKYHLGYSGKIYWMRNLCLRFQRRIKYLESIHEIRSTQTYWITVEVFDAFFKFYMLCQVILFFDWFSLKEIFVQSGLSKNIFNITYTRTDDEYDDNSKVYSSFYEENINENNMKPMFSRFALENALYLGEDAEYSEKNISIMKNVEVDKTQDGSNLTWRKKLSFLLNLEKYCLSFIKRCEQSSIISRDVFDNDVDTNFDNENVKLFKISNFSLPDSDIINLNETVHIFPSYWCIRKPFLRCPDISMTGYVYEISQEILNIYKFISSTEEFEPSCLADSPREITSFAIEENEQFCMTPNIFILNSYIQYISTYPFQSLLFESNSNLTGEEISLYDWIFNVIRTRKETCVEYFRELDYRDNKFDVDTSRGNSTALNVSGYTSNKDSKTLSKNILYETKTDLDPLKLEEYLVFNKKWPKKRNNVQVLKEPSIESTIQSFKDFSWKSDVPDKILIELKLSITVNFDLQLFDVMSELYELLKLGYVIPTEFYALGLINNILSSELLQLTHSIDKYSELILKTKRYQLFVLKPSLYRLEDCLMSGLKYYTWHQTNLEKYIKSLNFKIRKIYCLKSEINEITSNIFYLTKKLRKIDWFEFPGIHNVGELMEEPGGMGLKEFFFGLEERRDRVLLRVQKIFDDIHSLVFKLEFMIHRNQSGNNHYFIKMYEFIEKNVLKTLSVNLMRNMKKFKKFIGGKEPERFELLLISVPEIVYDFSAAQCKYYLTLCLEKLFLRYKTIPRWRTGTCKNAPIVLLNDQAHSFLYNYLEDLTKIKNITLIIVDINNLIHTVCKEIATYISRWEKYHILYEFNEEDSITHFLEENEGSMEQYHFLFSRYEKIIFELRTSKKYIDIFCARINLKGIRKKMLRLALNGKELLKDKITNSSNIYICKLHERLMEIYGLLVLKIHDLEGFQNILHAVNDVPDIISNYDVSLSKISEMCYILGRHGLRFNNTDREKIAEIQHTYFLMRKLSAYRQFLIDPIKKIFGQLSYETNENFVKESESFADKFLTEGPGSLVDNLDKGASLLDIFKAKFVSMNSKKVKMQQAERLFFHEPSSYSQFEEAHRELLEVELTYNLYRHFQDDVKEWSKILWIHLITEKFQYGLEQFVKEYDSLPDSVKQSAISKELEKIFSNFKITISLMNSLKTPALRKRHWAELMHVTGHFFDTSSNKFNFGDIVKMKLHQCRNIVLDLIENAKTELKIENYIKNIEKVWSTMTLKITCFSSGMEEFLILSENEDVKAVINDHYVYLHSISASPFSVSFSENIKKWSETIDLINKILNEWLMMQEKWIYLRRILNYEELKIQLPEEFMNMKEIDNLYTSVMESTKSKPRLLDQCVSKERLTTISTWSNSLDESQRRLRNYLNQVRDKIPRFLLLSDDELLFILGSVEPRQNYITKIFENIKSLNIKKDSSQRETIVGMVSQESEELTMLNPIEMSDLIEFWLPTVVFEMKKTMKFIIKSAIYSYQIDSKERLKWILNYLGPCVLVARKIWWTVEVEGAFLQIEKGKKMAMKCFLSEMNLRTSELLGKMKGSLEKNERRTLNSVLILDCHEREIINRMVKESIQKVDDFEWEGQLKFYWVKTKDDIVIRQCRGEFSYGYEYMGNSGRLVISPLTEKVYLSVTQALAMNFGITLTGTSGSGKTDTIKDLSKAFGILCVVFNCSPSFEYNFLRELLNALCSEGIWGCFDEFNKVNYSVQSVISMQLENIRNAFQNKTFSVFIDGRKIILDPKFGLYLTINPGYSGKRKLLDSVRFLCRPIACTYPDIKLICEVILYSNGFLNSKVWSEKLTTLYRYAKTQLSKMHHYDFGMMALKSLLSVAGDIRRRSPDMEEQVVLMRALSDMDLPKLIPEDIPYFLELITNLFPGSDSATIVRSNYVETVEEVLRQKKFIVIPAQVEKIMQIYEIMKRRHCVIIAGSTGGGKTVLINTLCSLQSFQNVLTSQVTLNSNAYSIEELYGILDPVSQQWSDGILCRIFREFNTKPFQTNERRYIIFDGDLQSNWIDNMNSVMDENKVLTLTNGERIPLHPSCTLLFECGDMKCASPAAISRAGMVYVDPSCLGYCSVWKKWTSSRVDEKEIKLLNLLYEKYVPLCISFVSKCSNGSKTVPQTTLNMVVQLCFMLDVLIPVLEKDEDKQSISEIEKISNITETTKEAQTESKDKLKKIILKEFLFIQALFASFGASLFIEEINEFDESLKMKMDSVKIEECGKSEEYVYMSDDMGLICDYYLERKNCQLIPWKRLVKPYFHENSLSITDVLVPNENSIKFTWILALINKYNCSERKYKSYSYRMKAHNQGAMPVMLVGDVCTFKTSIMFEFLQSLDQENYLQLHLNFNKFTTSYEIQGILESYLEKQTESSYVPLRGKKLIFFIDDFNQTKMTKCHYQQPVAFLRLFFEKGGMFGRKNNLNWKSVDNVYFYNVMGNSYGEKSAMDTRFLSKFLLFNIRTPSDGVVCHIFSSILQGHTNAFKKEINALSDTMLSATLEIFKFAVKSLRPTPSKFYYIFTFRDISKITNGLLLTSTFVYSKPEQFVRVWRNEVTRVICDRLINSQDNDMMKDFIKGTIIKHFSNISDYVLIDPLLFGDYRNAIYKSQPRFYEDLLDYEAAFHLLSEIIEFYKTKYQQIDFVLFEHLIDHITRVHRILLFDGGHGIIVGPSGIGKKSIITLATFTAGYELFTIPISRKYSILEFRESIKSLYSVAGLQKQNTTFFLNFFQIIDDEYLVLVSNMVSIGKSLSLFSEEEKRTLINKLTSGKQENMCSEWSNFVKKCEERIHIIISMTPGDSFIRQCRYAYRALIDNCTIDYIAPWPAQALDAVAKRYLIDLNDISENRRNLISGHLVHIHQGMPHYMEELYIISRLKINMSLKHYINFINLFLQLMKEKYIKNESQSQDLEKVISKINATEAILEEMNKLIIEQKGLVEEKINKCRNIFLEISQVTEMLDVKKKNATEQMKDIDVYWSEISKMKNECQILLNKGRKTVEVAKQKLETFEKNYISDYCFSDSVPETMKILLECILTFLGETETKWNKAKEIAKEDVSSLWTKVDPDSVNVQSQKKVKLFMKRYTKIKPSYPFNEIESIFLEFVETVSGYCSIDREIKPKKDKINEIERDHTKADNFLQSLRLEIESNEVVMEQLNLQYSNFEKERETAQKKSELMQDQLDAANRLIMGLSSEKERWQRKLTELQNEKLNIPGKCSLSAAFLTYAGAFPFEIRQRMIENDWIQNLARLLIPVSVPFSVKNELSDDVLISKWIYEGVASDDWSLQNAILISFSSTYPLCIDPHCQALNWITKKEIKNYLKTTTFDDSNFLEDLEMGITIGIPILIKNVDFISPLIYCLLEKCVTKSIQFNGKCIPYNDNFKLYMTTKLETPSFDSMVYSKMTVINFAISTEGLEEQFLNSIIYFVEPDLQNHQEQLYEKIYNCRYNFHKFNETMLQKLIAAKSNFLENTESIQTLEDTKSKINEVTYELENILEQTDSHLFLTNKYKPIARSVAALFNVVSLLSSINHMYLTCLDFFMGLFKCVLKLLQLHTPINENSIYLIRSQLNFNIYRYICRGIFGKHRILFSFLIAYYFEKEENEFSKDELVFLIKGSTETSKSFIDCPVKWLSEKNWKDIQTLSAKFEDFEDLIENIVENTNEWFEWFSIRNLEKHHCPNMYTKRIKPFKKLLLLRCFRMDRIYESILDYVKESLGDEYIMSPVFSLGKMMELSNPTTPVILISSPGIDSSAEFDKFARSQNTASTSISLGEYQNLVATNLLNEAKEKGLWILYKNCHIELKFLSTLEKCLNKNDRPKTDFRLWMASEPINSFPIGILQQAVKVVCEPSCDVKPNLHSTYMEMGSEIFHSCSQSSFKSLLFNLAYVNALIQGRQKYARMGWNMNYNFVNLDFLISVKILDTYLKCSSNNNSIPWKTLKYLIGEITYGGHVFNKFDQQIIRTYLDEYFGDFLFDVLQPFCFYDGIEKFGMPNDGQFNDYLNFIEDLPLADSPSVFGLHTNINIFYYDKALRKMWKHLYDLQTQSRREAVMTKNEEVLQRTINNISEMLPYLFDINHIKEKNHFTKDPVSNIFLQELKMFNLLVTNMSSDLDQLKSFLAGKIQFYKDVQATCVSLLKNKIPEKWRRVAPETGKRLGGWLAHMKQRKLQFDQWAVRGNLRIIWLTGLYSPRSYLVALLQAKSKLEGWAFEKTTFNTEFTKMANICETKDPYEKVYIKGLFLKGASWDHKDSCLKKSTPSVLIETLPLLSIVPVESQMQKYSNTMNVPVYTSIQDISIGDEPVFEVELTTSIHNNHWILQGTCILFNSE